MLQFRNTFFLITSIFLTSGCTYEDEWTAKRPETFRTTGIVRIDGKPIDGATVVLHAQSHDLAAQGVSDAEGKFSLTTFETNDGAVSGKHKVVVIKRAYEEVKTKFNSPDENSVAKIPKELLPKKYASSVTTDIETSVAEKGSNNLVIELKSK